MRFTALLVAVLPTLASAWKVELFESRNQVGLIYELSGSADHKCHDLPKSAQNRARSYRWASRGVLLDHCSLILYVLLLSFYVIVILSIKLKQR